MFIHTKPDPELLKILSTANPMEYWSAACSKQARSMAESFVGGFLISRSGLMSECVAHDTSLGFTMNDLLDRGTWRWVSERGVPFNYRPILLRKQIDEASEPDRPVFVASIEEIMNASEQFDVGNPVFTPDSMSAAAAAAWIQNSKRAPEDHLDRLAFGGEEDARVLVKAISIARQYLASKPNSCLAAQCGRQPGSRASA